MKTVQIYNLHLVTGEVVQAAEDYELKGKKTIVSLFQRADDEDIFLITDLLLGSCYIPKKNIAYIATGDIAGLKTGRPHGGAAVFVRGLSSGRAAFSFHCPAVNRMIR